eukprot:TRINITY_DN1852_c0_g1_i1.p1 TRINITY_DN1852_c0_g1~~TRINITY_DN1852_c0_g1_i1.p1  ORF type:complete len:1285 (-),score=326.91 TRINITY_DN1852_c0_g1_i1:248-4033(-)
MALQSRGRCQLPFWLVAATVACQVMLAVAKPSDATPASEGTPKVSVERRLAGSQRLREDLRVIVRYADGASSTLEQTRRQAAALEGKAGVKSVKALPRVGMAVVMCHSEDDVEQLMTDLADDPAVDNVMPDTMVYLDDAVMERSKYPARFLSEDIISEVLDFNESNDTTTTDIPETVINTTTEEPSLTMEPIQPQVIIPDDPLFSELWGMEVTSQNGIDAVKAWSRFTGQNSSGIVVGVIDTGIDYTHEDLKNQMWHNPGEIPDNGIDDDGNGIIDDVYGANFVTDSGDPFDDNVHGTHCAGTIAAIGNNGIGVAGVAWGGVKLMALKFLAADGSGRTSDAIGALDYALAMGARITSNSWGGGGSSNAMRVAIERSADAGMLFVAAAGNSGSDNDVDPHYPSSYDVETIVAVASTEVSGNMSSFSCYGAESVDVAAPGSKILSTIPHNKYEFLSGTSMATPHVSGLAALVWMYRPSLDVLQVRDILLKTATKMTSLHGKVVTGAQINALAALSGADEAEASHAPVNTAQAVTFQDTDGSKGFVTGTVVITAAVSEVDVEYYKIFIISAGGYPLGILGEVNATGAPQYFFEIDEAFPLPDYAAGLEVVTGNSSGEGSPWSLTVPNPVAPLVDYIVPAYGPRAATWGGDTCIAAGCVGGKLTIERAEDESTITAYEVYWHITGSDAAYPPKAGSIPTSGFKAPQCEGEACDKIEKKKLSDGGVSFTRTNYGNDEGAAISFSGPATVVVTQFQTEEYYDYLLIGGTPYSGKLATGGETFEVDLPAGESQITWFSDFSESGGSWSFELYQKNTMVDIIIADQLPRGDSLKVLPVYEETPGKDFAIVDVLDYNQEMPPSPAYKPLDVAWKPTGNVASVLAPNLTGASVEFFQIDFADAEGNILGGGWKGEVTESLKRCHEEDDPNACWLTVPLSGLKIGRGGGDQICVDVCAEDKCVGTYTNPLPDGERWTEVGRKSSGCCARPFPGWGKCSICCKPVEENSGSDITTVPADAKMLVARAGNDHGLGVGFASMELEFDSNGALVTAAAKEEKPRLRGATLESVGAPALAEASAKIVRKIAASNPWLLRLGRAALTKKSVFAASKAKLSPNRIVGSVEIRGWEASVPLKSALEVGLAKALTAAAGDDRQALVSARVLGVSPLGAAEPGTQVEFAIEIKKRPMAGNEAATPAGVQMLLDNLEARFATLALGGALRRQFDKAVTAALKAVGQSEVQVQSSFGEVRQARHADPQTASATAAAATKEELYP